MYTLFKIKTTSFLNDKQRIDNNFLTFPSTQVDLKGYALWNVYAQYKFLHERLNIFVDAKNLTNTTNYYEVFGYSVQGFNLTGGLRFQL